MCFLKMHGIPCENSHLIPAHVIACLAELCLFFLPDWNYWTNDFSFRRTSFVNKEHNCLLHYSTYIDKTCLAQCMIDWRWPRLLESINQDQYYRYIWCVGKHCSTESDPCPMGSKRSLVKVVGVMMEQSLVDLPILHQNCWYWHFSLWRVLMYLPMSNQMPLHVS